MAQDYRALASSLAQQYKLPWFAAQINQESGFKPGSVSPAGAQGIAQIVPRWHPDAPPASDPAGQLRWAAQYMAGLVGKYGNPRDALSVYNSGRPWAEGQGIRETNNYVKSILGASQVPTASTPLPTTDPLPVATSMPGAPPSRADIAPMQLAPMPDFSKAILSSSGKGLDALTNALVNMASAPPRAPRLPSFQSLELPEFSGPPDAAQSVVPKGPGLSTGGKPGKVNIAPTADRAGASIKPAVVDFVSQVASIVGRPLEIGTGTNHNQYVKGTHRQSQHWTGDAADIPASGEELTRLGQAALIAAGMPRAEALKQHGGIFSDVNGSGIQIIFNTNSPAAGGNHFNHLHVGL